MEFIETIKIADGVLIHPEIHLKRMHDTVYAFFNKQVHFDSVLYNHPVSVPNGLAKCRILYNSDILDISITSYRFKEIGSLKLIESDRIDYRYKYNDRSALDSLLLHRNSCDDILIAVNRKITDTSYSNVVFSDETGYYTPKTFLLNGTKRQFLLSKGIIREREIQIDDIPHYRYIHLINAMIDLEDQVKIPSGSIL